MGGGEADSCLKSAVCWSRGGMKSKSESWGGGQTSVCMPVRYRKCVRSPGEMNGPALGYTSLVCVHVRESTCVRRTSEGEKHSNKLLSASILPAPAFIFSGWGGVSRRITKPQIQAEPQPACSPALHQTPLYLTKPSLMKC